MPLLSRGTSFYIRRKFLAVLTTVVGQAGLEPAMPSAPDLQSGGVTNFPTDPYKRGDFVICPRQLFTGRILTRDSSN